ncbi:NPCBM/NEW2 domain-containing protein [Spirosoma soli]|uniref:NPCBM/NEW2 domain-containing protein n=1 Tax=Spirosoma soli TaxID=1770529 RepID=A0ABW5M5S1_9BACT
MRILKKSLRLQSVSFVYSALVCLAFHASTAFGQTTYYVASSGNDNNNGRSADSPFQTVSKVSSLALQPGDQILFKRGDTFRGTLFIRQSGTSDRPIVIDAYGSGNKPSLSGSVPVSNWSNVGGNVWQADCPSCGSRVTGLYRNASPLPLGRYPNYNSANKGYLTVQSHSGKSQLTSQQSLPTNFTGGEAVIRPVQWILDRATITQQNGNTLSLNNPNSRDITDGWGYFIQNHPATLDQTDEWYYNPGNKTIRLYADQGSPNGQNITVTVHNEGVNLKDVKFVTIRNLQITQTLSTGLLVNSGSNLVIAGNDITDSGEDGMYITGYGGSITVENNLIEDANNNGLTIQPYQNFTFRGNTVQRIGLWPGRGRSGDGTYVALTSLCTANTLIENNVIDNVGYNGISYTTSTTIRRNRISNFCITKSDGGGLYVWNGNRQAMGDIHLVSNIIYNGIGAPEGTPGGAYAGVNGIFFDDCTQNIELANNSVFNCHGLGIFMHATSNITVSGNTVFNNGEGQLAMTHNHGVCPPRNNTLENNIFVSRLPEQFNVKYESDQNDLGSYGQFNRNVYARPFEDLLKIRAVYNNGSGITGADLSLKEWQDRFGKDANSSNSPLTYKTYTITGTGNSKLNSAFSGNTEGWSTWSPYGNGQAVWDNSNRLDGGSLRVAFPSGSGRGDSYVLVTNNIGSVSQGKTYQLRFDAVASSSAKRVQAFIRQKDGSYRDLDARSSVQVGTNRQSYDMAFTATANEANAIVVFQVTEDGQTVWFDNVSLQEATRSDVNPDDYVKLVYNETGDTKQVSIDGTYRDARNNVYTNNVSLPAFSSMVLFKEVGSNNPPAPPVSLRDPENPANAVNGLDFGYFEGDWGNLPNFDALTPAKTGTTSLVDLSVRNRDSQYALRFKGFINVPTDGQYTFYTNSDDGSKLYIGSTEVVNNDGGHAPTEKSGTIGLKAGKHALTVTYFQGGGGQQLNASYSGPGVGKQDIPASALYRVGTASGGGSGTGLQAEYFNNTSLAGPVVLTRTDATVNFDWGSSSPAGGTVNGDNFSVRWTGQIEAPVTGDYTFSTFSDNGVRLWVNGVQLVNNWNEHGPAMDNANPITLTGGQKYDIKMEFYEVNGGAAARLLWAYPGQSQQAVPQGRLYPAAATSAPSSGAVTYLSDLNWKTMNNGYGPVEKDRSNGESGASDGRAMSVNGVGYAKGLGVHAPSELTYDLGGRYTNFSTDIGIDDELADGTCGSVEFQVFVDNALVYSSGTMTTTAPTKSVNVNVSGKQTLRLVVTNAGDDNTCDHADWAGARLTGSGSARVAALSDEIKPEALVQVYPIPARDEVRVRYYALAEGEVDIQLVNTGAQPVRQLTHQAVAGENIIKVPVSELSRGFYMLTITQGSQRITRKVILSE